jgi:hypothetical protein
MNAYLWIALALFACVGLYGVIAFGLAWLALTFVGAFLGLALCWLGIKGLERTTSFRL